ncbi:MAG: hypothetical protein EOP06_13690, partial [Proteobacteria bacterium]
IRLLRLTSVIYDRNNTYTISIGGMQDPQDLGNLSTLLLLENMHFLFRPAVVWGGQKLLFQNLLEVARQFDLQSPPGAWFQVICNRSYPLVGPRELAKRLQKEIFKNEPSQWHKIAPPGWHQEWPPEIVQNLPEYYSKALDSIFEIADATDYKFLAEYEAIYKAWVDRTTPQSFNFSDKALLMSPMGSAGLHKYAISPFGVDARWMSFARPGEFVDTSAENGFTFSRRADPIQMAWAHKVISQYNFRIGEPFVTLSRRFVSTMLHDDRCIELMAAMNHGFGPEMNAFDTIGMSDQFELEDDFGHLYIRNANITATDEDVEAALSASENENAFFMRKTLPTGSAKFIDFFSKRISEEWPQDDEFYATSEPHSLGSASIPSIEEVLSVVEDGAGLSLRDLFDRPLGAYTMHKDGEVRDLNGHPVIKWSVDDNSLILEFEWGSKKFHRVSAKPGKLVFAPDEIVSAATEWSIFAEVGLGPRHLGAQTLIVGNKITLSDLKKARPWKISHSEHAALLGSFERLDDPEYPVPVKSPNAAMDNLPPLAFHGVAFADQRCSIVLRSLGTTSSQSSSGSIGPRACQRRRHAR